MQEAAPSASPSLRSTVVPSDVPRRAPYESPERAPTPYERPTPRAPETSAQERGSAPRQVLLIPGPSTPEAPSARRWDEPSSAEPRRSRESADPIAPRRSPLTQERAREASHSAPDPKSTRVPLAKAPLSRMADSPYARRPEAAPPSARSAASAPAEVPRSSRIVRVDPPREAKRSPLVGTLIFCAVMVAVLAVSFFFGRKMLDDWRAKQAEQARIAAEETERVNHPLNYREIIEENASDFGLNPALVAAIILCESSYNPDSISGDGAQGLMQLMPSTAEWIAESLNEPDFTSDRVFEPEVNIRFGCWYLKFLAKMFDNDPTKTIAAYHAGQGHVTTWLSNPVYSPDGVTLKGFGDPDTERYTKRVLSAIKVYQKNFFQASEGTTES